MRILSLAGIACLLSSVAMAAEPIAPLTVRVSGFEDRGSIPDRYAYCVPDGKDKYKEGPNVNPAIEWSGAPEMTKSFAIIVVDRDVPETFESANQEGKVIPFNLPRQDFYHWVLVDIPPSMVAIAEGKDSNGIVPGGKLPGKTAYGVSGQNDYVRVFEGNFGGYDGPCPPWNDERVHHYHFIVYALDVATLGTAGTVSGKYAEQMMEGHILAKGEIMGTYTNYKHARKQ